VELFGAGEKMAQTENMGGSVPGFSRVNTSSGIIYDIFPVNQPLAIKARIRARA
jgi:hypothetical protein